MQTNPVKAIREYCLECCLNNPNEVRLCNASECPLWAFRLGKNPYRTKRELTEEQLQIARERMKNANQAKLSKNHQLPVDKD